MDLSKVALRFIALAEIAGAIAALVLECISLVLAIRRSDPDFSIAYTLLDAGFCIAVVALTFVAGVRLWKLQPSGLRLSAWSQLLQIPTYVSTAFSYKVKLGIGIWIFWHFQTWYLGFTAELGEVETLLTCGSPETPTFEINILAVAFLIFLLRAMARNRRIAAGYKAMPAPRRSATARVLRFAYRSLLVLLAIVLIPVFVWWICNRFDEAPTPQAQHWFAPLLHQTADAQNAWLFMLGLGAAEDRDPIAFGRQRLDAYEARQRERVKAPPSAPELALKDDPLPFKSIDADGSKLRYVCNIEQDDCLGDARFNAADLAKLEQINAVRLRRYTLMLELPRFEELSTPSDDDPIPSTGDAGALYRALILRDLNDPQKRVAAFTRLTQSTQFWQRVGEQAQSMVEKQIASRLVMNSQRILDAFVDEYGVQQLGAAGDAAAATVLRAPGAGQHDLELPLRRNAIAFQQAMAKTVFGPVDMLRFCQPTPQSSCLMQWLIAQAYAPQATLNLRASLFESELELYRADARENEAARKLWGEVMERYMFLGKASESLHAMLYNFAGKTVAYISVEAAVWGDELHDREAFRRMLLVKFAALRQHIAPAAMADFLAAQSEKLSNPYGGHFLWDAAFNEIYFKTRSGRSKRPYLTLAYREHAEQSAHRIEACAHPLRIALTVSDAASNESVLRHISSCGAGLPSSSEEKREEERETLFNGMVMQFLRVAFADGHVGLRIRIRDGEDERDYTARDAVADGREIVLQRDGHKGGPELRATVDADNSARGITMDIDGPQSLQQLAREVAHVANIEVRHMERLGNAHPRLTIRFDRIAPASMLQLILDVADARIEFRELGNGSYDLVPAH
jgi:hypothetical protein